MTNSDELEFENASKGRGRSRQSSHLLGVLLTTAAILMAASAFAEDTMDPRLKPPLVQTSMAKEVENGTRSFTGIVAARVESGLGFRVSGKVVQRLVDRGQAVKKGQPLMKLDDSDLRLALRAKDNAVIAAEAVLTRTRSDEQRSRKLLTTGAVSRLVYEQSKQSFDTAVAQLDAVKADADFARNELGYSILYADSDGIVTDTLVEPGEVVAAGQPVAKFAYSGDREASVDLPEDVRPAIGTLGLATIYGSDAAPLKARLRQLSNAADPATRTFEARYVLEKNNQVPLGSTVKVTIDMKSDNADATDVPIGSIYDNGKTTGVWVVRSDSKVKFTPVKLLKLGDESAVVSGLAIGTPVVAVGVNLLNDGMAVRLNNERIASR